MHRTTHKDQWAMFIIGLGGGAAFVACSAEIKDIAESNQHPADFFDRTDYPQEPGVYQWQGEYWSEPGGNYGGDYFDADCGLVGKIDRITDLQAVKEAIVERHMT